MEERPIATGPRSPWPGRLGRAVLVLALVLGGGVAGIVWSERRMAAIRPATPGAPMAPAPPPGPAPGNPVIPDASSADSVEVSLSPDAMARIGLKVAVVKAASGGEALVVPGTITPNAYRDTKVNALVGGVVRGVSAELGSRVTAGQRLAVISSAELAESQMKYLSMQAMLEADHLRLRRTEKLVDLGSASRQELEEVTAVHAAHATEVAAARERLVILGLSPQQIERLTDASQIVSDVAVVAPADGVVTGRAVNSGQVVGVGQELFVVADLSTVWAVGEVYERDIESVREGQEAEIIAASAPAVALRGRVAYIDPRVDPTARTARVRVALVNPQGSLRFGMYVTMRLSVGGGGRVALVPRSAVQPLGEGSVVYVAAEGEGRFVERRVTLGAVVGDAVQVLGGVKPGDRVVTEGSFFLRAEAVRSRSGG